MLEHKLKSTAGTLIASLLALGLSGCLEIAPTKFGASRRALTAVVAKAAKPPTTAVEDFPVLYNPALKAATGSYFTFSKAAPSWAILDKNTGILTGTPTRSGNAEIQIALTDGVSTVDLPLVKLAVTGDPLLAEDWTQENTGQLAFSDTGGTAGMDLNTRAAFRQYGKTGMGTIIAVSDTGLQTTHEDLSPNMLPNGSRDYRLAAPFTGDPGFIDSLTSGDHGTAVAGIIAAAGWNNLGGRGVAPKAKLVGFNFITGTDIALTANNNALVTQIFLDQVTSSTTVSLDVVNQSWGSTNYNVPPGEPTYLARLGVAATTQRANKGTIVLKAAGNEYKSLTIGGQVYSLNANVDPYNSSPYGIVVAALDANGKRASYSSPGSCNWISAPAGEFGTDSPASISTDVAGCESGYANRTRTPRAGKTLFNRGDDGNQNCSYTSSFNGTSAATPHAAGVVALLLEAKPDLTARDVKYILAKSAVKVDPNVAPLTRTDDPVGYINTPGWVTNAAGFNFHNWYGFGRLDARAALELASTYTSALGTLVDTGFVIDSNALTTAIPDNSATGVSINLPVAQTLKIEALQLQVTATHPDISEVGIELTSPAGTKSVLFHTNNASVEVVNGALVPIANFAASVFLSNAFFGETATGTWVVKIVDAGAGSTGTVTRLRMRILGHN